MKYCVANEVEWGVGGEGALRSGGGGRPFKNPDRGSRQKEEDSIRS